MSNFRADVLADVEAFVMETGAPLRIPSGIYDGIGMAKGCDQGRCKYANPKPEFAECVGHRPSISREGEYPELVIRYGPCPRHRRWMQDRRQAKEAAEADEHRRKLAEKAPRRLRT